MDGITVIVVPTWAVWAFVGFAVVNIAQHIWKIELLRKQARRKPPNCRFKRTPCRRRLTWRYATRKPCVHQQ